MSKIDNLSAKEIDVLVAKAIGLDVVGEVLCYNDPESGYPQVDTKQQECNSSFLGQHRAHAYVSDCICSEEIEMFGALRYDRIFGHCYLCLDVVPNYSSDWHYAGLLIKQFSIAFTPYLDNTWAAHSADDEALEWVVAAEPCLAIAKAVLALRFGHNLEKQIQK